MRRAVIVALGLIAGGCNLKPAPFPTPDGELGPRPGLLTGPTGEVTIGCCASAAPPAPTPTPTPTPAPASPRQ